MYQNFQAITGAPLTNDADPSVTPPSSDLRVMRTGPKQSYAIVQLVDGTSCTATAWTKTATTWVESHNGSGNEVNLVAGVPQRLAVDENSLVFIRLTSIVGSPTTAIVLPCDDAPSFLSRLAAAGKAGAALVAAIGAVGTAVAAVTTAVTALQNATKSITQGLAVSKHDTNTFTATRQIFVGTGGDMTVKFAGDAGSTLIPDVLPGVYDWSLTMIYSTGTDAGGFVALY